MYDFLLLPMFPLVTGVIIFIMARNKERKDNFKECPKCKEPIRRTAMICWHCRYEYTAQDDLRVV